MSQEQVIESATMSMDIGETPVESGDENTPVETAEVEQGKAAEPQGATESESQPPEESGKKNRFQERISELVSQREEERKQREELQKKLADIQAQQGLQGLEQQWQAHEPKLEDYATDVEWTRAWKQWDQGAQQAREQAKQTLAAQAQQQLQQQQWQLNVQRKLQESVAKGAQAHEDYMQVIQNPNVPSLAGVNPVAYEAVMDSDHTAELLYFLAKNPDQVNSLAGKTPIQTVRAIAKMEGHFDKPAPVQEPPPPPPSQLGGGAQPVESGPPEDIDDWMAWRRKQSY